MTRRALFGVLWLCVLFAGCASFRSDTLGPLDAWPPEPVPAKKSIGITIHGLGGKLLPEWSAQATHAYEKSGLFSRVEFPSRGGTDLTANVKVEHEGHANLFFAFLTGLTLYILPSKASDQFTAITTFSDSDGKALGTVSKTEKVTMWQQLFLVFLTPFKKPETVLREAYYDINRATLIEARSQEVF